MSHCSLASARRPAGLSGVRLRLRGRRGAPALAWAALLAAGFACAPPPAERVVLVTIDTLRADHLGSYGGPVPTPALDALAEGGVRFATAISPTPLTLPSHTSLLTALDPPRHGVRNNSRFRLAVDVPTLAEQLRDAGFATAAFVGAMVLDRQYGLARGFDVYDDRMSVQRASSEEGFPERSAGQVVDAALRWLERAPERFFLWVHVFDPHADYAPPREVLARLRDRPYLAEVVYADRELGRLFGALEARWPGGTLVVATSDHGESLGEHGEQTHSLTLYDATQRVPLLLRGPGVPGGRVVETPVRLVDVAPTILARAGAPPLPDTDGADLSPLFGREASEPRAAYLETLSTQLDLGWSPLFAVRSQGFKYVRAPRPELYDLRADPEERENLHGERPEVAARLDALLAQRLSQGRPIEPASGVDPEARRQLEALGYVVAPPEAAPRGDLGRVGGIDPKDGLGAVASLAEAMGMARSDRAPDALARVARIEGGGFFRGAIGAEVALEAGDPQTAERYAREAVAEAPDFWESHVLLGRALEAGGRPGEAEAAYRTGAALDAAAANPLVGLGRLAEAEGERERAAALYEQAAARRGNSGEALWRLAALRIEDGDLDGARRLLGRVPSSLLARPDAALRLAEAESRAGRPEQARGRLQLALAARPDHQPLLRALAALD